MADKVKWTQEQQNVIGSRGQSLLVSAAAGSGKTAVLVQRILDQILDPEHPADIDRMLIVTFTRAAAAQLREKIRERLEEAQEEAYTAGDVKRADAAARQLSLLAGDHIETIDRFCKEVVLDHADLIRFDPAFRYADEGEAKLLKSDAAAQTIEEAYASEDPQFAEDFRDFSQLYAPGKKDDALEDMILKFYSFSESHAFPRVWRNECAQLYRCDAGGSEWMKALVDSIRVRIRELRVLLQDALEVCRQDGGPYHYLSAVEAHDRLLASLENCTDMEQYHALLDGFDWPRPDGKKKSGPPVEEAKLDYVKKTRESVKKELERIRDTMFPFPEEESDAFRRKTARYMDVLVRLTDSFEDVYSQMKRSRNIADFSDIAHNALQILIETDETGTPVRDADGGYVPTGIAGEYADYYEQIYIDEYQDSNPVQDLLLWSVSRKPSGGQNRFLVGDVKQSIYRFRMAEPEIFSRKAAEWPEDSSAQERRIDLHANFRSRKCVIDAVNLIFRQIMRREIGGIEYDEKQELTPGYPYPEDPEELFPELLLTETADISGASDKTSAEAEAIAQRILQIVGKMKIFDKETKEYRTVNYGDITILLRTSRGWAECFSRILSRHGIPNRSGSNTGYFDAPEVRTILSYLNVLDNPRQDIPLAASLRSGIGHLDDTELAKIRALDREGSFYDCVLHYAESGEDERIRRKLEAFLEVTGSLRRYVKDTPIHLLLWKIYDETGYADMEAASEGGRQKRANLDLLADKAIAYEETSYRGLFHFIRYIEKLRKGDMDFGLAESPAEGGNEVTIMTMHSAKGLEFPVTFVCGLGKKHNLSDTTGSLVLHSALGAGLDYVDRERRVKIVNRIRSAISDRIRTDSIGEELRILYVAMTRAEQKLILSGCVDDRAKYLGKASAFRRWKGEKYSFTKLLQADCMLDWVIPGLLRHATEDEFFDDSRWDLQPAVQCPVRDLPGRVRIITGDEIMRSAAEEMILRTGRVLDLSDVDADTVYDEGLKEHLTKMLSMRYAYRTEGMPGKVSVSEIKAAGYEAELERLEEERDAVRLEEISDLPRFLLEEREEELSGTARGTAYHEVLAAVDFLEEPYPGQIAAQLETMVKCDRIHKDEARSVNPGKIERFLKTDLAERMRAARRRGELRLEQPFVIGMRGNEIREEWNGEETVLIQGIIDAFFVEDEHIILIDYKTDRVQEGEEESLVRRYLRQFELYRDALERLLKKKVAEAWLYSLSLEKAIRVSLQE